MLDSRNSRFSGDKIRVARVRVADKQVLVIYSPSSITVQWAVE